MNEPAPPLAEDSDDELLEAAWRQSAARCEGVATAADVVEVITTPVPPLAIRLSRRGKRPASSLDSALAVVASTVAVAAVSGRACKPGPQRGRKSRTIPEEPAAAGLQAVELLRVKRNKQQHARRDRLVACRETQKCTVALAKHAADLNELALCSRGVLDIADDTGQLRFETMLRVAISPMSMGLRMLSQTMFGGAV
jgi:hypothetical protein